MSGAAVGHGEERVLAGERELPHRALDQVAIDLQTIVKEQGGPKPFA